MAPKGKTTKKASAEPVSKGDLQSALLSVLERAESPLAASKIRGQLPKGFQLSAPELTLLLDDLVREGCVFSLVGGRTPTYSRRDLRPQAESLLLEELKRGPASLKDLKDALKGTPFKDPSKLLESLAAVGRVYVRYKTTAKGKSIEACSLESPINHAPTAILELLKNGPLKEAEIKKKVIASVGVAKGEYLEVFERLVKDGRIHGHRGKAKSGKPNPTITSYGLEPEPPPPNPIVLAEAATPELLKNGPVGLAALKKRVTAKAEGLTEPDFKAVLERLAKDGRIHGHRGKARNGTPNPTITSYGLEPEPPPDPSEFVEASRKAVVAAIATATAAGVSEVAVVAALLDAIVKDLDGLLRELEKRRGVKLSLGAAHVESTSAPRLESVAAPVDGSGDQNQVLSTLRELVARERAGALIPIRALRSAIDLSPNRFDAAVLALSQRNSVILHHHDLAGDLSETERSELVRDRYGTYYVGIALGRTP